MPSINLRDNFVHGHYADRSALQLAVEQLWSDADQARKGSDVHRQRLFQKSRSYGNPQISSIAASLLITTTPERPAICEAEVIQFEPSPVQIPCDCEWPGDAA